MPKRLAMNILVTSYYFYPDNTPRAFRAYELVKELARQRQKVTVHIPDNGFDYTDMELKYGIKIVKVKPGVFLNRNRGGKGRVHKPPTAGGSSPKEEGPLKSSLRKLRRKTFLKIYFDDRPTEYSYTLARSLLGSKEAYDAVVSIGLPFSVHVGTAIAVYLRKTLAGVRIADYGDPFSKNLNRADTHQRWHSRLEKFVLGAFDYITVPIGDAVESYLDFKDEGRIKVIPQGICFDEVEIAEYTRNEVPTFVYGGNFYRRLRNPRGLMDFLAALDEDFRFILYTNTAGMDNMSLLGPFKEKLGKKLEIRHFVPRLDFIREASKADFLVNIDNLSTNQLPSKIIDYALSGRPILSFGQDSFSPSLFREFLRGEFGGGLKVDVDKYDIKNVCEKFLMLIEQTA
jgi:hypothetical protein